MSRHLVLRFRAGGQRVIRERTHAPKATIIDWTDRDGTVHYFRFIDDIDDKTGLDVYEEADDRPDAHHR